VKADLGLTNYPMEKFKFIEGNVLETLNDSLPNEIALLRLDTDWYDSTKKEMTALYPNYLWGECTLWMITEPGKDQSKPSMNLCQKHYSVR
jgi:hypothetical protein